MAVAAIIPTFAFIGLVGTAAFVFTRLWYVHIIQQNIVATSHVYICDRKIKQDYNPNWWKIDSEEMNVRSNRTASGSKRTLVS